MPVLENDITIRRAVREDKDAINHICRDSMLRTYGSILSREGLERWINRGEVEKYTSKMLEKMFVAVQGAHVVALAAVEGNMMDRLWVREDQRGHGVGGRLLGWVEDEVIVAAGFRSSELECFAKNIESVQFYKRHGYAVVRQYYFEPAHTDKVLMTKTVGPPVADTRPPPKDDRG